MQQIERYGVIALLLVLATVLGVSLWSGGETTPEDAALTADSPPIAVAERAPRRNALTQPPAGVQGRPDRTANGQRPTTAAEPRNLPAPGGTETSPIRSLADARTPRVDVTNPGLQPTGENGLRRNTVAGPSPVPTADPIIGSSFVPVATRPDLSGSKPNRTGDPIAVPVAPPADSATIRPDRTARSERPISTPVNSAASANVRPDAPAPVALRSRSYVVRPGDTLSEISSRELGTSRRWEEIVALNPGLDAKRLHVGTKIQLPEGVSTGAPSSTSSSVIANASTTVAGKRGYVVQPGDMLSMIALRELGSVRRWTEIRDLNPTIDPDRLQVGALLALPEGGSKLVPATETARASQPRVAMLAPRSTGSGRKGRVQ